MCEAGEAELDSDEISGRIESPVAHGHSLYVLIPYILLNVTFI
jgi:hypothetical protein